ncbi:G-type lectin S-receptor-like serine/threonine-protein kinase [Vitis vinifera]|uniref:G-type lectin S-receptor-like serine/threonine-protein kinase n=1 Tax=Vitis vinifera TaxID=29760 RepID=A0A438GV97_VITVI|nr:G-type lectin S-receptor-like serine/threonine-protein kinase [Vitis vinifera]
MQKFSSSGADLYILVADTELGEIARRQEIAVKRLSRASAQGLEEFLKKLLKFHSSTSIVSYLLFSVLDAIHLDPVKRDSLTWRRHFSILEGIARGLLYLHRDSRLRIIHRDL